jgi:DNA-directed RNA polymerase specialized sigma24 family protein
VNNLTAWLTTVVSRVCLDMLRSRASRGRDLAGYSASGEHEDSEHGGDPEEEAVLLDSVGRALLVVLNTLQPAERIAFVLHDMFTVPFNGIAPILSRSPAAAKKIASRARDKVRSRPSVRGTQLARHPA